MCGEQSRSSDLVEFPEAIAGREGVADAGDVLRRESPQRRALLGAEVHGVGALPPFGAQLSLDHLRGLGERQVGADAYIAWRPLRAQVALLREELVECRRVERRR